jgi:LDH2 family malate/lactate/ureidoglycolate dehydrogenase
MSATPPGAFGALLDQDTPDTIRLSVAAATALGERALRGVGLSDDDVRIIVDQLIDNALCGYPTVCRAFSPLPRRQDAQARQPMRVSTRDPVSALSIAATTAMGGTAPPGRHRQGASAAVAVVGVYNSYYSGRNAYYMEMIIKAGLVGIHLASASRTWSTWRDAPGPGTNPLCFGFPRRMAR